MCCSVPPIYLRGVSAGQGVITSTMTRIYNRKKDQQKRRNLRKNMPKSEVLLWMKLKNHQMHGERFLRQYGVDQNILDFYCPNLKLAVEVDGDSHFIPGSEEKDKARQLHIEAFGVRFLRFTNTDVCENLDEVCRAILNEIQIMERL
jgi:very-short-patch-repair endonuclease